MNKVKFIPILLLFTLNFIFSRGWTEEKKFSLENLSWIAGCWQSVDEEKIFEEQWMKPSGKSMLGMGRMVSKGETVFYEFLQIRQNEKQEIFYIASPSGQKEAAFKLVKMNKTEAVFENPEHDFPQRIIYRLENDSTLLARIEGKSKGKDRREDFPMKKVRCD